MPGHNYIDSINSGTRSNQGGSLIQIVDIGTNQPIAPHVVMKGYLTGALMINTSGDSTTNILYVNRGTVAAAIWRAVQMAAD